MTAQPARRPGGRSARIRADVHRAAIELLAANSWDQLTLPRVAEHSGVHQATVYRRWGTVSALLDDVVTEQLASSSPVVDTGSLRGDIEQWAVKAAEDVSGPLGIVLLRAAVLATRGGDDEGRRAYMVQRGVQLQAMFDRATGRGEQPPTIHELLEVVLAPLYFHALFWNRPADADHARVLVARLLDVVAPAAGHAK